MKCHNERFGGTGMKCGLIIGEVGLGSDVAEKMVSLSCES